VRGEIQQAYYGERGGGHRLLGATEPEDPIFQRLAGTTDHLSAPERGQHWEPYVSGYPFHGRYVLARTFAGRVTTRAGWAFTHVLVLEADDAAECTNLRALLNLLATVPELGDVLPLDIPETTLPAFGPPNGRVGAAVQQLLERGPDSRPVVWLGQNGFEDLLARVWAGLWPDARALFSFRTAFKVDDADRRDTVLFSTPVTQAGRWTGFPLVREDASHAELSPAEALLAGSPSLLKHRIGEFTLPGDDLRALRQVEAIDADLRNLGRLDPSGIRMLLRRLGSAAASPSAAQDAKKSVLNQLADALPRVDVGYVHTLRNVEPGPFGAAFRAVEDAVAEWTRTNVPGMQTEVASLLIHAEDEALDWWRRAVRAGVRRRLQDASPATARLVWDLWRAEPRVISETVCMPEVQAIPDALAQETPSKLTSRVADAVLNAAQELGWVAVYAAVSASAYPLSRVFDLLLGTFDNALDAGLEILSRRAKARDIIRAVAARGDQALDTWTAGLIAAAPALRGELDPGTERGRALWLASVDARAAVWAGVDDTGSWLDAVLDALTHGDPAAEGLVRHIARTPAADLGGTRWENRIWHSLPPDAADGFIRATAAGWIPRFRRDPENVQLPGAPLRARILEDPLLLRAGSSSATADLAAGLTAIERFGLGERSLLAWMRENSSLLGRLRSADGERLGGMVASQQWRNAAQEIYRRRSAGSALYVALHRCRDLLSLLDRLWIAVEWSGAPGPSTEEWYATLHAFLETHLHRGPEHDYVWERAGGTLSRIRGSNAREQWWSALEELKHGRGKGDLSLARLLDVLAHDYPNNPELDLLRKTAPHG
jgi:GTPase-associated protein 1, N-terminal domain type 1/Effector-associated domain 1